MEIKQNIIREDKYKIKCPYTMEANFIVVHNTANDASAENEIAYMINNDKEVSFHYAIDDKEVIQGIPENRNAWHAGDGNGEGNRKGIGLEICYSKSGGEKFEQAEKNAVKFIASKLKEKGWGIDKVKKHQDFNGKYCPHRTLDLGWDRFLNLIKAELGQANVAENVHVQNTQNKIDIKYQVYANGKWLPDVVNLTDYAGVLGQGINCFRGNTVGEEAEVGKLVYKVHTKGGNWLGEIVDREKDKSGDDFAGIKGRQVDAIMIKATKGTARYRVHTKVGQWLPWVTGYNENDSNNGYAGIMGAVIDAIQVEIV